MQGVGCEYNWDRDERLLQWWSQHDDRVSSDEHYCKFCWFYLIDNF